MNPDLDQIMSIMEAAFDPAFGEAWTRPQVSDALLIPGTHYLLVGSHGETPASSDEAVGFTLSRSVLDEEELLLLAVNPDHRKHGLGTLLLTRFISAARDRGIKKLFLEMRDGNSAGSLYLRQGFVSIGRRRNYYRRGSDGPRDAITFALEPGTCGPQ